MTIYIDRSIKITKAYQFASYILLNSAITIYNERYTRTLVTFSFYKAYIGATVLISTELKRLSVFLQHCWLDFCVTDSLGNMIPTLVSIFVLIPWGDIWNKMGSYDDDGFICEEMYRMTWNSPNQFTFIYKHGLWKCSSENDTSITDKTQRRSIERVFRSSLFSHMLIENILLK